MIEKLALQNFQSHKNSELELHPGVNVIVGESNSGKTAILRALYWLAFGKPAGTSIIRHNIRTDCSVAAWLDNEEPIQRIRGKTENCYLFGDEEYRGFGQNVPEPIVRAFNMTDINFARQLDAPFLLSKSSGEVAQYLNKLANLDVIGTSLSNIASMTRRWGRDKEISLSRIEELEERLNEVEWIEQADKDLQAIENEEQKYNKLSNVASRIARDLNRYYSAQEQFDQTFDYRPLERRIEEIEIAVGKWQKSTNTMKNLHSAIEAHKTVFMELDKLPDTKGAEKAILDVENKVEKLQKLQTKEKELQKLIDNFQIEDANLESSKLEEQDLKEQLEKEMPDVCPLCEQMTGEHK